MDGCGLLCKYVLIIFNVIFALLGFTFLGLGLWLRFSDNTRPIFSIEELNSSAFVIAVTVLIVMGSLMLIVVSFGDYGACNEKVCALKVFSCLLVIMAVAEITIGVLAYAKRDEVGFRLGEFYVTLYTLYATTQDPVILVTLTFIHQTVHCCGVTGVPILEIVKNTCPEPASIMEHLKMPACPSEIASTFDTQAPLVMGVFVGTACLLITALVCAGVLVVQTKKSQEEMRTHYSAVY